MKAFGSAVSLFLAALTLASCAPYSGQRTVFIEGEGNSGRNDRESTFSGYRNSVGTGVYRSSSGNSGWTPTKQRRTANYDHSPSSTAYSQPRRTLFGHSPLKWSTPAKRTTTNTTTASAKPARRYWFTTPKEESTSSRRRAYTVPQNSELAGLFSNPGSSMRSSSYSAESDGFGGYRTTSRNGSTIRWRPKLFGGYTGVSSSAERYSIRPSYESRSLLKPATSQGQLFDSSLGYDSGSLLHKNRSRSALGNYSTGYSSLGSSSSRSTYNYGTSSYGVKKYGTSSGSSYGYGTSSGSGYSSGSLLKSGTGSGFGSSSGYGYGKSSGGSSGYGSILK